MRRARIAKLIVILGKALSVLPEAELFEPVSNRLGIRLRPSPIGIGVQAARFLPRRKLLE